MMALRLGAFLLALAYVVDCQPYNGYYDCRRDNIFCGNICESAIRNGNRPGECICLPGQLGYDCSVTGILATANDCPACSAAVNNGQAICYRQNALSPAQCFCGPAYVGADCNSRRVRATCNIDSVEVSFDPVQGFNFRGQAAVKGFEGVAQCQLNITSATSATYYRNISLSQCGVTLQRVTLPNGNQADEYTVIVGIRHSSILRTGIDEEHRIICQQTIDGTLTASISVGPATSLPGDTVVAIGVLQAGMEIRTSPPAPGSLGVIVANTVLVGTNLDLRIFRTSSRYQSFNVESCTVSNLPPGNVGRTVVPFITNGCPDPESRSFIRPPMRQEGDVLITPFEAALFDTGVMFFECDVNLCLGAGEARCSVQPNCAMAGPGLGRKRRQAEGEGSGAREKTVVILRVTTDPSQVSETCPSNERTVEPCLKSTPFLAVTAVFGALLLVALLASIYLCVRMKRSQREADKPTPYVYENKISSSA